MVGAILMPHFIAENIKARGGVECGSVLKAYVLYYPMGPWRLLLRLGCSVHPVPSGPPGSLSLGPHRRWENEADTFSTCDPVTLDPSSQIQCPLNSVGDISGESQPGVIQQ